MLRHFCSTYFCGTTARITVFSEGFVARINLGMKQMEESLKCVSPSEGRIRKTREEIQGTADCLTSASEPPPRSPTAGRKWPRPEEGRGQRRRMEGGTEGTGSGRDPHGVVDGRRKQQKERAKEKQQRSSRQTGSGCQAVEIRRREKQMNLFLRSGK